MTNQISLEPTIRIINGKPIYFYNLQQLEHIRDKSGRCPLGQRPRPNPFTTPCSVAPRQAHTHTTYA